MLAFRHENRHFISMITIGTYHWIFDKSNMTGATGGAGTALPSQHMISKPTPCLLWFMFLNLQTFM